METASRCRAITHGIVSSLTINKVVKHFPTSCENRRCYFRMPSAYRGLQIHGLKQLRFGHVVAVGCVAWESGPLEREVEAAAAEEEEEEEEEWMRAGRCKERKGMVELLECLETEAIMGEDHGREPTDYNRRAQIFDKSSRVFQALKARTKETEAIMGEDHRREPTDLCVM